jgi:sterol desaturase/sphingolipid hydroxylase (fatty acid hydroxylase superfamily)
VSTADAIVTLNALRPVDTKVTLKTIYMHDSVELPVGDLRLGVIQVCARVHYHQYHHKRSLDLGFGPEVLIGHP